MAVQNPTAAREQRAAAALVDVVDVRELAPSMYEVTTVRDTYQVDVELGACTCPDFEYNDPPMGRCKHIQAARIEAGATPVPTADDPAMCPDCSPELACFEHFDGGER